MCLKTNRRRVCVCLNGFPSFQLVFIPHGFPTLSNRCWYLDDPHMAWWNQSVNHLQTEAPHKCRLQDEIRHYFVQEGKLYSSSCCSWTPQHSFSKMSLGNNLIPTGSKHSRAVGAFLGLSPKCDYIGVDFSVQMSPHTCVDDHKVRMCIIVHFLALSLFICGSVCVRGLGFTSKGRGHPSRLEKFVRP